MPLAEEDGIADPIEFIRRDHERQFETCDRLDDLVNAQDIEPVAQWAGSLHSFFSEHLPRHFEDEEQDLFPLLLERCGPDANLAAILDQLVREHELDQGLIEPILEDLDRIAGGGEVRNPNRFHSCTRAFAETQRRHLNWENRVVLPLCSKVLTEDDLLSLGRRMTARRQSPPEG